MLLSIIIPLYNCSPVITRCLASIDYPEAEIIVVDDGSTDDSAKIVRDYSHKHKNVRLIQKKNGGVSSARNTGIESAKGKYIMFIDADDYLVPGGINRVIQLAEQNDADVVTYRIISVSNEAPIDSSSIEGVPMNTMTVTGKGNPLFRYDVPDFHVVDALFKLSTIIENGIRFSSQLSLREDDVFCGMLFCHTNTIIVTDLPLYRYVRSSYFSATHSKSINTQRKLVTSSYLAMKIRGEYVQEHFPEAMPWERLKYMRWVCHPKTAFRAGYSLPEYRSILKKYNELGCWPLDHNWVMAAGLNGTLKLRVKNRIKTFLCNHPWVAYQFLTIKQRKRGLNIFNENNT